jgi:hypothetical protein
MRLSPLISILTPSASHNNHDSTSCAPCVDLWYALCPYAVVALLTFGPQPTGGDLVWAHEEMKQLFLGLAEVIVSMLPST